MAQRSVMDLQAGTGNRRVIRLDTDRVQSLVMATTGECQEQ